MIGAAVGALVILGGIWFAVTTLFSPPSAVQHGPVPLVIRSGESTQEIADDLARKGLIRNAQVFRIWARIEGLDRHLQAGVYALTPGMGMEQIIHHLQSGQPDEKRLKIIEGWRLEQIAGQLRTLALPEFSVQDFLRYTHHPEQFPERARYPLLRQASSMEGLLFPDTYLIPINYTTAQVIEIMLNRLNQVVQEEHLAAQAQQHQLSEYQMIILASIVQREAANDKQMPLIAGIYWKRLYQPSPEIGARLEADPTVQYARDTDHPPSSPDHYWKPLNDTGGKIDPANPWNTYNPRHAGWPPTPIASPGRQALQAAAAPTRTDCYFFLTRPGDGSLACAATYARFQQLEKQYLP